jgi:ATP-dependent Clp protease ATP-binding subunit ClpA
MKSKRASDALWNLLLGILDKAVLTVGDNRRVDFSPEQYKAIGQGD